MKIKYFVMILIMSFAQIHSSDIWDFGPYPWPKTNWYQEIAEKYPHIGFKNYSIEYSYAGWYTHPLKKIIGVPIEYKESKHLPKADEIGLLHEVGHIKTAPLILCYHLFDKIIKFGIGATLVGLSVKTYRAKTTGLSTTMCLITSLACFGRNRIRFDPDKLKLATYLEKLADVYACKQADIDALRSGYSFFNEVEKNKEYCAENNRHPHPKDRAELIRQFAIKRFNVDLAKD